MHNVLAILLLWFPSVGADTTSCPTWVVGRERITRSLSIPLPCYVTLTSVLTPDTVSCPNLKESLKRFEYFRTRFDADRNDLERRYLTKQGRDKVSAAKDLMNFIIEKENEWWGLAFNFNCVYKGPLRIDMDIPGIAHTSTTANLTINVGNSKRISGTITDGQVSIGGLFEIIKPVFDVNTDWSATFSGHFDGLRALDRIVGFLIPDKSESGGTILITSKILPFAAIGRGTSSQNGDKVESNVTTDVILPFAYGHGEAHNEALTGYLIVWNSLHQVYEKIPINESLQAPKGIQPIPIEYLQILPSVEEPPFAEYLDKYFRWYVSAVDRELSAEFAQRTDSKSKSDFSKGALNELRQAQITGEAAGVDLSTIDECGLCQDAGSLYDKWLENWLLNGLSYYDSIKDFKGELDFVRTVIYASTFLGLGSEWFINKYGMSFDSEFVTELMQKAASQ